MMLEMLMVMIMIMMMMMNQTNLHGYSAKNHRRVWEADDNVGDVDGDDYDDDDESD